MDVIATARPVEEVDPACPVCGLEGPHQELQVREMLLGTRESFPYLLCALCGSVRIAAIPADPGQFYPPAYRTPPNPDDLQPGGWLHRRAMRLVARGAFFGRPGRLSRAGERFGVPENLEKWQRDIAGWSIKSLDGGVLDVGCGPWPYRLLGLRAFGFSRLLGVDPFIESDARVGGVRIRRARIEDVRGSFATIMFHHVLEHVVDPLATLVCARHLLRPRGSIVVRTPVMGSALWDRYGADWWELDAPRHLFVFSRDGMDRLAQRAGLKVVRTRAETSYLEFAASEQYRRDIPSRDPRSILVDPAGSLFGPEDLSRFRQWAQEANGQGRPGRLLYILRAA